MKIDLFVIGFDQKQQGLIMKIIRKENPEKNVVIRLPGPEFWNELDRASGAIVFLKINGFGIDPPYISDLVKRNCQVTVLIKEDTSGVLNKYKKIAGCKIIKELTLPSLS